jgi:serine/threonine protein kinase
LRYLHAEWEQCVVHGDIKPSNIMLDSSLDAKLGDFGLARLVDHGVKPATTKVVLGTAGYIDPELVNTRRPSAVSDVYSFGVVLLELVTGRRPVEEPDDSDELFVLIRWVWRLYGRNAIAEAVDERLKLVGREGDGGGGEVEEEEERGQMERALVVGLWCAQPDRGDRPSIAHAMHVLQSADVKLPVLRPHMYASAADTVHSTIAMGGDGYSELSFGVTSTDGSDTSTTSERERK